MNAIEIRGLRKNFGKKQALKGLDLTVPEGAVYGLIGENGSGKSTTEKLICGLMNEDGGTIRLYGRDHTDPQVRSKVSALIEAPGCYPDCSVWNNMMLQAANLQLKHPKEEVRRVLKLVRMEGAASNQYRNCSLGMKQRIGIAMALMGDPQLLILDEPINGLDADGMRIVREILADMTKDGRCSVLISSHVLGELEKAATHYGIIRNGRMLAEMSAEELTENCRTYTAFRMRDAEAAQRLLRRAYFRVEPDEDGRVRVYDPVKPEDIAGYLYRNGCSFSEMETGRISLEEYYLDLMDMKEAKRYA